VTTHVTGNGSIEETETGDESLTVPVEAKDDDAPWKRASVWWKKEVGGVFFDTSRGGSPQAEEVESIEIVSEEQR